jgi:hypothetical protein
MCDYELIYQEELTLSYSFAIWKTEFNNHVIYKITFEGHGPRGYSELDIVAVPINLANEDKIIENLVERARDIVFMRR